MKSNQEWQAWGKTDPFWAVSTWKDKEVTGSEPWTANEFYAYGAKDWADFQEQLRQYGYQSGSCLEIGCGAGRLTKHLAATFNQVIAVDVAEGMLERAREHIKAPNIKFVLSEDGYVLPCADDSIDVVFSTHVFQHFERPDDAIRVFAEAHRVLKPDGTIMIHLPIYEWPNTARRMFQLWHAFKLLIVNVWASYRRLMTRFGLGKPFMRGTCYRISWLMKKLSSIGFRDIELRVFEVQSNGMVHPFILATKQSLPCPS